MNKLQSLKSSLCVLLCVFCLAARAQYSDYNSDYDDKDAIATNQFSPRMAQLNSAWSMSNANIRTVTKPNYSNGSWRTTNAGLGQRSTYRSPGRKTQIHGTGTHTSGSTPQFVAAKQERLVEAQRQAKIEQKKKEIKRKQENAADRRRGFIIHNTIMAPYRAKKAARDQWMATEGTAQLNMNHTAANYARVPTAEAAPKVSSLDNDELADLFNEKKPARFTVVDEDGNVMTMSQTEPGQDFGFDEGDHDDNAWDLAWGNDPIVKMPHNDSSALGLNKQLLVSNSELCLDSLPLFVLPGAGLVALLDEKMVQLRDTTEAVLTWFDGKIYSYAVPCADKLIGRREMSLFEIKNPECRFLMELDAPQTALFAKNDESVYALVYEEGISTLFDVNPWNDLYKRELCIEKEIWKVERSINTTFVSVDNSIFALDSNSSPHLYTHCPDMLADFTVTPCGMVLGTEKGLYLVTEGNTAAKLDDAPARNIWYDNDSLYILDNESNLYLVTDFSSNIKPHLAAL